MWYLTSTSELVNFDHVASFRVTEEIQENKPKEYWVTALLPTGLHHMRIEQFKTPDEGKKFIRELKSSMSGSGEHIIIG